MKECADIVVDHYTKS